MKRSRKSQVSEFGEDVREPAAVDRKIFTRITYRWPEGYDIDNVEYVPNKRRRPSHRKGGQGRKGNEREARRQG